MINACTPIQADLLASAPAIALEELMERCWRLIRCPQSVLPRLLQREDEPDVISQALDVVDLDLGDVARSVILRLRLADLGGRMMS